MAKLYDIMIIQCCQMAHVKLNMRIFILMNQELILLLCICEW